MSQHDLSIANQTFPATRSDINSALQALGSLQSGATAPSTTYANQFWLDTTTNILKLRNSDNDAWIEIFDVDQVADKITLTAKLVTSDVGSQSAPSLTFDGDTDTGIYRSAANELSITTGGSQRVIFESDGDVVLVNGTPALKLKDLDSTGNAQVGQIDFVDSADATNAQIGYLSGANTDLTVKNAVTGGKVKTNIAGTDRLEVNTTGVSVTGNATVSGSVSATSFSGSGASLTGLPTPSFSVEARSDTLGNDTSITLSANTVLVMGTLYHYMGANNGSRSAVQLKDSGGSVIDDFLLTGGNEGGGTDGGSGMSARSAFTIAIPSNCTSIRIYRQQGSNSMDGTINQFLKFTT